MGAMFHVKHPRVNTSAALAFVVVNGSPVEKARLVYLLTRLQPSEPVRRALFNGQRPDGGWSPFWASDYSGLDATCFRLAQAYQLSLDGRDTAVARAVEFLSNRQLPDGGWEEDSQVTSLAPPWAMPGNEAAKIYLTANCGLWNTVYAGNGPNAQRAVQALRTHLSDAGQLPSFMNSHWLAGGLLHLTGESDIAGRVFDHLRTRLNELSAGDLAWMGFTLSLVGLPPGHALLQETATLLEQSQAPDGRWQSQEGEANDVQITLDALSTLRYCGRF